MNARFRPPYADETLSSYLTAWRGHFSLKRHVMMDAIHAIDPHASVSLAADPDFPSSPNWANAVASVTRIPRDILEELARPRTFAYLAAAARTNACVECLARAQGVVQQYRRHQWAAAAVTMCWTHRAPLVDVPAVGWEWVELPNVQRFNRRGFMHHPERRAYTVWKRAWKIPPEFRDAIQFAEHNLWAVGTGDRQLYRTNLYAVNAPAVIWRDLLTLLCASWQDFSSPSLATRGLPPKLYGGRGVERFGGQNRPVLTEAPTFEQFCALGDPAERRACVLMAWEAMRIRPRGGPEPPWDRHGFGWHLLVETMPEPAFNWLYTRARAWPSGWSYLAAAWHLRRLRAQNERQLRHIQLRHIMRHPADVAAWLASR